MRHPRTAAVLLLASLAGLCEPARAQGASPAELRREVDRLNEQLRVLRDELDQTRVSLRAAEQERAALAQRLRETESLLAELRARGPGDALPPTPTSSDPERTALPEDPLAAPGAIYDELRYRYERDLAPLPRATDQDRAAFRAEAQRWCKDAERQVRGRVHWVVRLENWSPSRSRRSEADLTVVDPVTLRPLGESVRVEVPARLAERVQREPERELWRASLLVTAKPIYNPDRAVRGVFDSPRFVGPMVEFDFSIEWLGLAGVDERPDEPDAPPSPGAPGAPGAGDDVQPSPAPAAGTPR